MNKRLSRMLIVAAFALIFTAMLGIIALGLLTAARNQSAAVEASAAFIVAQNRTTEALLAATETALVAASRIVATDAPCGFVWARQLLPEVERQARAALDDAGLAAVEIRYVEAYGENCVEADGQVRYFAAMTTDFYLSAEIDDASDEARLGQTVERIYHILTPLTKLPARHGYLDMIFTGGGQERRLRVMFEEVGATLDAGQTGAALWAALQS